MKKTYVVKDVELEQMIKAIGHGYDLSFAEISMLHNYISYLHKEEAIMLEDLKDEDLIPIEQLEEWQKQYGNRCTFGTIMKLVEEWKEKKRRNFTPPINEWE